MRSAVVALGGMVMALASACGPNPAYEPEPLAHPTVTRTRPARRAAARTRTSQAMVGKWVGVGTQSDGQTWLMEVDLRSLDGGQCASIKYPAQHCGGVWQCQASDGASLRGTEQITYGRDTCLDQGEVDMHLTAEGKLLWTWTGDGVSASATLSRAAD